MISFKDPRDQLGSGLFVGGIALLVGALAMLAFVKPPSEKGIQGKKLAKLRQASNAIDTANERIDVIEQVFEKTKWTEKPDLITGEVLSIVREATGKASVKLISFRPQRSVETTDLLQLPYVIAVDGSFPNVVKFVQSIEESDAKLAVSSFQLASAEGTSDFVTASIGLVAYRDPYIAGAGAPSSKSDQNKNQPGEKVDSKSEKGANAFGQPSASGGKKISKETKEASSDVGKLGPKTSRESTEAALEKAKL